MIPKNHHGNAPGIVKGNGGKHMASSAEKAAAGAGNEKLEAKHAGVELKARNAGNEKLAAKHAGGSRSSGNSAGSRYSRSWVRLVLAALFIVMIGAGLVKGVLAAYANAEAMKEDGDFGIRNVVDKEFLEEAFVSGPWKESDLIDLNGTMARKVNMRGFYGDQGIYVADNGYLVSVYPETTTDFEFEQLVAFKKWCDEHGIQMLYVNEPTKYLDDDEITQQFGLETFSNRNADKLMARLREAGIPAVDLRDYIKEEGLSTWDMFYRTDHHWTTRATLWAAPKVMKGLNDHCGYDVDLSIYDESNYEYIDFENCWLGEQGRKVGEAYVGLDDFTEIYPKFETSYTFKNGKGEPEGDFKGFINEDRFDTEMDVYENKSWHYGYKLRDCINRNVDDHKVLLLGDSYEQTLMSFISLGVHELDVMMRRDHGRDYDLHKYILKHDYDTVIITYAQLMIGAHDDPKSSNGKMFIFDPEIK